MELETLKMKYALGEISLGEALVQIAACSAVEHRKLDVIAQIGQELMANELADREWHHEDAQIEQMGF